MISLFFNKRNLYFILLGYLLFLGSCKKYLDKKPVKGLVVPTTLNDLQALLDMHEVMNENSTELPEALSDNYYLTTDNWQSNDVIDRDNYIWDRNATHYGTWVAAYQKSIYHANVVLDQLPDIKSGESDKEKYNNVKGAALFYRAFMFQRLADVYSQPYVDATANADLGIVLRLTAEIESPSSRASVKQTYNQIINDLKEAAELLPQTVEFVTRPNKTAAYAALARTYLTMRDYTNAGKYADLALQQNSALIDYNTVSAGSILKFNKEVIFYSRANFVSRIPYFFLGGRVDSTLYSSYNNNDLRKSVFFIDNGDNTFNFYGSYDSETFPSVIVDGLSTDEMFLIRAECNARSGKKDDAISDLNTLMIKRWQNGTWVPFSATDANDALSKVLVERRKELVYRGLRWSDIRRLNIEGRNITLKRFVNNTTYTLSPNDLRFTQLIPAEVMKMTNLPQTPR